ncbi:MAG: 2-oxo acid dehydrogenase subunit E2, partial [Alicyclobacillus sp.]|nr:2-oxo acid dehydrogenase subunit E2 [Alicyclobacillus sp.]
MAAVEFRLPDIGEGIQEVEIVQWLAQEGERVEELEPLVEVQTDKAVVELPAPVSGRVAQIFATPGSMARVGEVLVLIDPARPDSWVPTGVSAEPEGAEGGSGRGPSAESGGTAEQDGFAQRPPAAGAQPPGGAATLHDGGKVSALHPGEAAGGQATALAAENTTPLVPELRGERPDSLLWRAMRNAERAAQRHAQPHVASGPDDDAVLRPYYTGKPSALEELPERTSTRVPFRGVRRATAERVTRSAFTAPHVTAFEECDASRLVRLRARWNDALAAEGQRLSYLPFLMKAAVSALRAYPYLNARLDEEAQEIELLANYHIGVAVDTPDGVYVPVVRHVDR